MPKWFINDEGQATRSAALVKRPELEAASWDAHERETQRIRSAREQDNSRSKERRRAAAAAKQAAREARERADLRAYAAAEEKRIKKIAAEQAKTEKEKQRILASRQRVEKQPPVKIAKRKGRPPKVAYSTEAKNLQRYRHEQWLKRYAAERANPTRHKKMKAVFIQDESGQIKRDVREV